MTDIADDATARIPMITPPRAVPAGPSDATTPAAHLSDVDDCLTEPIRIPSQLRHVGPGSGSTPGSPANGGGSPPAPGTARTPYPAPVGRFPNPTSAPFVPPGHPDWAGPASGSGDSGERAVPPAVWAAIGLAGLLVLGLFVDIVSSLDGLSYLDGSEALVSLVMVLPMLLLALGHAWLAFVLFHARPTAPWLAAVLAVCVLSAATLSDAYGGPGALVALGSLVLAVVVAATPAIRAHLAGRGSPEPTVPPVLSAAVTTAWWLAAGAVAAVLVSFATLTYEDAAGSPIAGAVLFLLVAAGAGWSASALNRGPSVPRAVLTGSLLADVLAVALSEAGQGIFWALVALHVAVLVAVFVPSSVRAHFGEPPLTKVDRVESSLRERCSPRSPESSPGPVRRPAPAEMAAAALEASLPAQVRAAPQWMRLGAAAAVALIVVVIVLAGSGGSDSSGSSWSGGSTLGIVVGLIALAAVFTPTMPMSWRAGLGAAAALSLWGGFTGSLSESSTRAEVWLTVLPIVVVAYAGFGVWTNWQTGATSAAPGWVGEQPAPPRAVAPLRFIPPPTAGARSRICLEATTAIPSEQVLAMVTHLTGIRGNWFVVGTDRVVVVEENSGVHCLGIQNSFRGAPHATFRARARAEGESTVLRVGGLEHWVQRRSYYMGFIPAGPAHVLGYWMYKLYLQTLAGELQRIDPRCRVSIGSPSGRID